MKTLYCINCGASCLRDKVGYVLRKPFCYECCTILTALRIGDPATKRITLYTNLGKVTTWCSGELGYITRETRSRSHRALQPIRFQVRMLDGSMWWGTGPSTSGDYVNLRRYKNGN